MSRLIKYAVFLVVYAIAVLLYINNAKLADIDFAYIYVVSAIITSYITWITQGSKLSVFFFFLLTYHLFIGGRFFAALLNSDVDIFEPSYFYSYTMSYFEKQRLISQVFSFLIFSTIGHVLVYSKRKKKPLFYVPKSNLCNYDVNPLLNRIYPILAIIMIPQRVISIANTRAIGYGAVVLGAEFNVSFVDKFTNMGLQMLFAIAIAYGSRSSIKKYFILFLITSSLGILSGSRAALGSCIFMSIWAYSRFYKVNLKKLALYGSLSLAFMLYMFSVSVRGEQIGADTVSPWQSFVWFISSNGVSLMVHEVSTRVHDYPIIGYVQTFITGATTLYSKYLSLFGENLPPESATFHGHLCYTLNPQLYYSGAGLGWTLLSDLHLFSFGNLPLFCIFSFFIGYIISDIDFFADKSKFYLFLAGAISPGIYMMSRGTSASLFAMIPYIYVAFFLVRKFSYLKKSQTTWLNRG